MLTRTYLPYSLTLLVSILVYIGFAAMSAVAASIDWIPVVSWLASMLHFGFSSWLFMWLGKLGRLLAIATAAVTSIWPLAALGQLLFSSSSEARASGFDLIYLLPVLLNGLIIYWHLKNFYQPAALLGRAPKLLLSVLPLGVILYVSSFYLRLLLH